MEDFMKGYKSLSHAKCDCKFHIVFIPKYHRKVVYGKIKSDLGRFLYELAKHKESQIVEGDLRADHVHMCFSTPPKYAVSNLVGYIKGKSAIMVAHSNRS